MTPLERKIEENRFRNYRFKKYDSVLRRVRLRVFDYEDAGKLEKAQRVIAKCKAILKPLWDAQAEARTKATTDHMMRTME